VCTRKLADMPYKKQETNYVALGLTKAAIKQVKGRDIVFLEHSFFLLFFIFFIFLNFDSKLLYNILLNNITFHHTSIFILMY
jgi:hypothetical protein